MEMISLLFYNVFYLFFILSTLTCRFLSKLLSPLIYHVNILNASGIIYFCTKINAKFMKLNQITETLTISLLSNGNIWYFRYILHNQFTLSCIKFISTFNLYLSFYTETHLWLIFIRNICKVCFTLPFHRLL